MGRIKTVQVKRITKEVLKRYPDKFTTEFAKNRESLKSLLKTDSKKLRNIVAGYVTRLVKKGGM
ncbi:30S ribosomal protein S17e [Candidatus Woesearchaeota archaeon]|nr:30S ribosomal protein S17e [Candidatus Woesearchaeota archaeon]